jgi:hypothetical protein
VREHKHGVEHVVELRESQALDGHQPPAVEHAQHRLVAFLLVFARDELLLAPWPSISRAPWPWASAAAAPNSVGRMRS